MNLSCRRAFRSLLALSLLGLLLMTGRQSRAAFNDDETTEVLSDMPVGQTDPRTHTKPDEQNEFSFVSVPGSF